LATHHAEGLVNPKVRAQKKVTDFRLLDSLISQTPSPPLPSLNFEFFLVVLKNDFCNFLDFLGLDWVILD
jgi:hypothetical protein